MEGEAGYVHAEVDDGQQNHGDGPAGSSGDGRTLYAQLRTAPVPEDECIVAQYVQHVDNACNHHRIDDLVGTTQRGGECQRQSLEERQGSREPQIYQSVAHQFRAESHEQQQVLGIEEKKQADCESEYQVDDQCHTHHLYQSFAKPCPDVLCTKYGGTHREELIDQENERDKLVVQSHGSHAVVAITTQHHGIYGTEQHDQCHFDKHWDGEHFQLSLQGLFCHFLLLDFR